MATEVITLAPGPIDAAVRLPGSKSITNRALLLAALAAGPSTLSGALFSDDSYWFIDGLRQLGVRVDIEQGQGWVVVHGVGGRRLRLRQRCGPNWRALRRAFYWHMPVLATVVIVLMAMRECASAPCAI